MSRQKLELALELLRPGSWERFEEFASAFLAPQYPNLRSVGTPSGDLGRDAEIFRVDGAPTVLFQYSVTEDWPSKIRQTASRVRENFSDALVLTYVTNQVIGAKADSVRQAIQEEHGLFLDLHDRTWFADRAEDPARQGAVVALIEDVLQPYLTGRGVIEGKAQALSSIESRAALLYLGLQWEDANREKGLTKLSFEALVLTVLRGTDLENRVVRAEVRDRVRALVPGHDDALVDGYTDSALKRLEKSRVRHWRQPDEFCLSFAETEHQAERLAQVASDDLELVRELTETMAAHCQEAEVECTDMEAMASRVRRVIERFFLSRGEAFASSLTTGTYEFVPTELLREIVIAEIGESGAFPVSGDGVGVGMAVAETVLTHHSDRVQRYLRSLSDAYTLLAFLRETPDVQGAVTKMFAHGEIWLDTSVVLPLFAEELLDPPRRSYTNMIAAARESGLTFRVTPGVIEEIDRHMNAAVVYAKRQWAGDRWNGRLPFLYTTFAMSGRARDSFSDWIERFRGRLRPEADIADFIEREWGIEVASLEEDASRAPVELRGAVQEGWHEVHEQRRARGDTIVDSMTTHRLVDHDVENYLGVVMKRSRERASAFGYTSWWMTLDNQAYGMRSRLRDALHAQPPDSPVISPDFMVNYLAIGPLRSRVPKSVEATLPLLTEVAGHDMPEELIDLADRLRTEQAGLDEHVIRRNVRDGLDAARRRIGELTQRGTAGMEEDLQRELRDQATPGV